MQRAPWFVVTAPLVAVLSLACDGRNPSRSSSPVNPSPVNPSPQPVSPSFTFSGVVTEYRVGPLSGVTMRARPNSARPPWPPDDPRLKTTLTDANGFYRIDGLTEPTIIEAFKDGYEPTGYGAFTGEQVISSIPGRRPFPG